VLDVKAHDPGFYMNRTRTYFVAQDGAVYLVRAPGQPVTLQREDDLPPTATAASTSPTRPYCTSARRRTSPAAASAGSCERPRPSSTIS
jgi:hypothetical protein